MRKMFGQSRTWVAVLLTVCMLLLTACGAGSEIDTRPAKSEEEAALTQAAKLTEAASQVTNTPSVTSTPEVDLGEIAGRSTTTRVRLTIRSCTVRRS